MHRKSIPSRAFWIIIVGGIVTGMGNGSVFGAAMMCFLGRGGFTNWGGWWPLDYDPRTFTGFIDWCMFVFGIAFAVLLAIALKRHDVVERAVRVERAARAQ
jgi:hypothetical protein